MKHEGFITLDRLSASDLDGQPVRMQIMSAGPFMGWFDGFFQVDQNEDGAVIAILNSSYPKPVVREYISQKEYASIRPTDDCVFEIPL